MRLGSAFHFFGQGVLSGLSNASLKSEDFTPKSQVIFESTSFVGILVAAVVVFFWILQHYWGWLSISGQGNPVLTSQTVCWGICRYAGFASLFGKYCIRVAPDPGVPGHVDVYSVELTLENGTQWECADRGCGQARVKTSPIRIHDLMISIIQKFLLAILLGYATFCLCFLAFIFWSVFGKQWKIFELVWLSFNGLYGVVAAFCISRCILSLADKVTDYLLVKTVCQAVFAQRSTIPLEDDSIVATDRDKAQTDIAYRAIAVLFGFDPHAVLNWGRNRADSLMFEGLESAFGQIIVVEISVIFLVVVMTAWAALSWHAGDPQDARLLNIQDALNAGAVLAWLLVVGLSLSAWLGASGCSKKMLSLILEARSANGKGRGAVVSKAESAWRTKSKVLGDSCNIHVAWSLQPNWDLYPPVQLANEAPASSAESRSSKMKTTIKEKFLEKIGNFVGVTWPWQEQDEEASDQPAQPGLVESQTTGQHVGATSIEPASAGESRGVHE